MPIIGTAKALFALRDKQTTTFIQDENLYLRAADSVFDTEPTASTKSRTSSSSHQ